jgi:hypothetical protein
MYMRQRIWPLANAMAQKHVYTSTPGPYPSSENAMGAVYHPRTSVVMRKKTSCQLAVRMRR